MQCVNNVFANFNSLEDAQLFLNLLSNQQPNLCFTCEEALDPSQTFLDVEVMIWNGEFDISVHHKPNLTGVLLHFNIIPPLSWK